MKKIIITGIFIAMMARFSFGSNIKEPNVSGQFYPDNPQELSHEIDMFFSAAGLPAVPDDIEMIIAPHAGYPYSGPVAAHSFKAVGGKAFKTIIILAPSHFYSFDGVSIWKEGAFRTPLGEIPVDEAFTKKLVGADEKFIFDPQAFAQEHALEVELPFLQKTFKDFKIVPIVMGFPAFDVCQTLAKTLNQMMGNRTDVLVVVSTDLSHYHTDAVARTMDQTTINAIQAIQPEVVWKQCFLRTSMEMCGFVPVTTALLLAKERGLTGVKLLKYGNSGDATGDKNRVVGYSSIAFYRENPNPVDEKKDAATKADPQDEIAPLSLEQKKRLMEIAKQTMETFVRTGKTLQFQEKDPRLAQSEGAFVTIRKHGDLRGCIGNIVTDAPLFQTVRDMAVSAASQDPRFKPVAPEELPDLDLEISVLSKPRRITNIEEFTVGVHGAIVKQGWHQGVFLPQVATETGWNRDQFFSNLCVHKAGLPSEAWKDPKTQIEIFSADVFSEKDLK